MCVLFVGWQQHSEFPLVVAANRDEFYDRPAAIAHFWPNTPGLLAGRDLRAGGTWLGVTRSGRFAALTNYREAATSPDSVRSRGLLVSDFLDAESSAVEFATELVRSGSDYAGYSILLYDGTDLVYGSNRSHTPRPLPPGQYGLSNHLLDTDWPKLNHGKGHFATTLDNGAQIDDLFALLRDRSPVPDQELPDTGVGREWERVLSPIFVATEDYGTRCATVVRFRDRRTIEFEERTFTKASHAMTDPSQYRAVRYQFPSV